MPVVPCKAQWACHHSGTDDLCPQHSHPTERAASLLHPPRKLHRLTSHRSHSFPTCPCQAPKASQTPSPKQPHLVLTPDAHSKQLLLQLPLTHASNALPLSRPDLYSHNQPHLGQCHALHACSLGPGQPDSEAHAVRPNALHPAVISSVQAD